MTASSTFDGLRDVAFFRGIDDEHLQQLAEIAEFAEYPAHSVLFREKDKAKDVYLIVSGQVSLISCDPDVGCRELMRVSDGDLIGWSPLVGRRLLADTAQTLTEATAFVIDGERLLSFCREDPRFGFEFMHRVARVLADRLVATRLQHLRMSGHQLPDVQFESD